MSPFHNTRVLTVSSGKGGVGKTCFSVNLALALAGLQLRTYLIDVDLGTANVHFLLDLTAPFDLSHLIAGEKTLDQIVLNPADNIFIIPGGSGLQSIANLKDWQFTLLINAFRSLDGVADIVIMDTGAGISNNVTSFLLAADELILITTPDPHAILDAFALLKVLVGQQKEMIVKLVVNQAQSSEEADLVKIRLLKAGKQFLSLPMEYLGQIPNSARMAKSVRERIPLLLLYPQDEATKSIQQIAARLIGHHENTPNSNRNRGLRNFALRLQNLLKG